MELWRGIPGFDLYEVSNEGRVRSLLRIHERQNPRYPGYTQRVKSGGRILRGWVKSQRGYPTAVLIALRRDGQTFIERVHRIVLLAFVGPCPHGMEGCHNDGDPKNNHLSNLRWDTHISNVQDCIQHQRKKNPPLHYGEAHPRAKLTEAAVKEIRTTPYRHGLNRVLGQKFGVTGTTIGRVRKGEWRHMAE
jgi:hypothetical protein